MRYKTEMLKCEQNMNLYAVYCWKIYADSVPIGKRCNWNFWKKMLCIRMRFWPWSKPFLCIFKFWKNCHIPFLSSASSLQWSTLYCAEYNLNESTLNKRFIWLVSSIFTKKYVDLICANVNIWTVRFFSKFNLGRIALGNFCWPRSIPLMIFRNK